MNPEQKELLLGLIEGEIHETQAQILLIQHQSSLSPQLRALPHLVDDENLSTLIAYRVDLTSAHLALVQILSNAE